MKPANIKLRPDGTVKVLDFGIAKALEPANSNSGPQSPALTTPAMTLRGKPLWSCDGNELFYLEQGAGSQRRLLAVSVDTGAETFAFGARTAILDWPYYDNDVGRTYDLSLDGQQFLVIKEVNYQESDSPAQIIITEHWVQELQRLVPVE